MEKLTEGAKLDPCILVLQHLRIALHDAVGYDLVDGHKQQCQGQASQKGYAHLLLVSVLMKLTISPTVKQERLVLPTRRALR